MTQSQALAIMKTGANVFLTGEPGSGKSYTINQYVEYLRSHGIEPSITASTGIAATHIGGMTIHSWSGIGIRRFLSDYDLDHIAGTEYVARRIARAHVLILDEVSMLDAVTLDNVDRVCRAVRNTSEPFGGLQVILVGDFFQLPPINSAKYESQNSYEEASAGFAYSAQVWSQMNIVTCYLHEQHRQDQSPLLDLLGAIRRNAVHDTHRQTLISRITESIDDAVTHIFSHNADVDRLNAERLQKIRGPVQTYLMQTSGKRSMVESLMKGCLSPEILELKQGAVVMFTKNNPILGFANGTIGTVVSFVSGSNYPVVQLRNGATVMVEPMSWQVIDDGKIRAEITQLPLRLAWGITVHKSQGMSMDAASIDLRGAFEYGQGYVALSRVRSLNGLTLYGYNAQALLVHPEVLERDELFRDASDDAIEAFTGIGRDRIREMHHQFIVANGGTLEVQNVDTASSTTRSARGKRAPKQPKIPTTHVTLDFIKQQTPIAEIARNRKLKSETIINHIEQLLSSGDITSADIQYISEGIDEQVLATIVSAFVAQDTTQLGTIYGHFNGKYTYEQLRLARLFVV